MLTQAARWSPTRERAMRSASSREPAVVRMMRTSVAGRGMTGYRVQGTERRG